MTDPAPYVASYAKNGSGFCGVCKEVFTMNTLQLAVSNQKTDMKNDSDNVWFHLNCFFTKEKPRSIEEIANFGSLLKEDQKEVRSKIDEAIALAEAELNGLKSAPEMRDFFIEYAKSTSAGFLNNCDERFRSVLKDDDEYLADSLPQEFSDVLKRLDLNETDDEDEPKNEKTVKDNDEDEKTAQSENMEKNVSDEASKCKKYLLEDFSLKVDAKINLELNDDSGSDPTQHGNNFGAGQQDDLPFEYPDQNNLDFGENEFDETEFDQDDPADDEVFYTSEEEALSYGSGDTDQYYYESDDDANNYQFDDNDHDFYDYGESAEIFAQDEDDCREIYLNAKHASEENVWNGLEQRDDNYDGDFGYGPM